MRDRVSLLWAVRSLQLQVLADFQAAKGDWRGSAEAHLSFARRLQEEGQSCKQLAEQLGGPSADSSAAHKTFSTE